MTNPPEDPAPVELTRTDPSVLATMASSEIDMQIATAHKFPRSLRKFKEEVLQMACLDVPTAEECFYSLPRRDQDGQQRNIEGPSARFAEIVASAWGNCRAGARVVSEDAEFITAQGAFHDLERNVAISFEVRRRITNKFGKRYNSDMIAVTGNAAASIALRNAVLKGVPKAFWASAYESARKTAIGDAKTLETRRREEIEQLAKMGIAAPRVYSALGIKGIEDMTLEHISTLIGWRGAIRDGDSSIEVLFPLVGAAADKVAKAAGATIDEAAKEQERLGRLVADKLMAMSKKDATQLLTDVGVENAAKANPQKLTPETVAKLLPRLGITADKPKTRALLLQELADFVKRSGVDAMVVAAWAQEQVGCDDVNKMTDEQLARFVAWLHKPAD